MEGYKGHLKSQLSLLFLHTTFSDISFLKGEIAKHLSINESNIFLREERTVVNDIGNVDYKLYTLKIFDNEFVVRFKHRVIEKQEIDVPRIVKNTEKKWWQFVEPDTKVVVEKKITEAKEYWLLSAISE